MQVSGEALQGSQGHGIDFAVLESVAEEVAAAWREGVRIAIVVGGGNYFRGASAWDGLERATADYVGMLATVMNALCLQVNSCILALSCGFGCTRMLPHLRALTAPQLNMRVVVPCGYNMLVNSDGSKLGR